MKFRKRPIVVEAWRWQGQPINEWPPWVAKGACISNADTSTLAIHTPEGRLNADFGDWIIQGVKKELYSCKPDVFAETYEPVMDEPSL